LADLKVAVPVAPRRLQGTPAARAAPAASRTGGRSGAPAGFVAYNSPYDFMNTFANGMSAIGPPWSQLTAYDSIAGKILWQVPNGEIARAFRAARQRRAATRRAAALRRLPAACSLWGLIRSPICARTIRTPVKFWYFVGFGDVPSSIEGRADGLRVGGREYVVVWWPAGAGLFAPPRRHRHRRSACGGSVHGVRIAKR